MPSYLQTILQSLSIALFWLRILLIILVVPTIGALLDHLSGWCRRRQDKTVTIGRWPESPN